MTIRHGGARPGAGNKSPYKTVVRRVPEPLLPALYAATAALRKALELPPGAVCPTPFPLVQSLPLFLESVRMGFPSPAEGLIERQLDLNEHLVRNPPATFILKASGESLRDRGIEAGDLLVVDRSVEARHGDLVVAAVSGEFTAKILYHKDGVCELRPANPDFKAIPFPQGDEDRIIGVVLWVLKDVRSRRR